MNKDIQVTRVFGAIKSSKKKIIANEGSSRSTKTFSILQYIIDEHQNNPGLVTTIGRERLTWIKATIIPDFKELMGDDFLGLWDERCWNKTESTYTINDGVIQFIGLDEAQKFHGRKQDIAWINEAVEAKFKVFQQLILRTKKKLILDYNPSYEQHWIYDKVITRDDCEFIHSTYMDNPFLDQAIVDEIERLEPTPYNIAQGTADEVAWKIYGLGLRAAHKGLIHSKVKIVKDLPPENEWKKVFYGLDFGFTNDPTALVQIVLAHGELYYKQLIYEKRLTNIRNAENPSQVSIQQRFEELDIPKTAEIYADSAEPKAIADLQGCGYNVIGADKGSDSIKAGLDTMKRYVSYITEDSLDGIKEKNSYKWKEDSSGNPLNVPVDMWNHFWDAARYGDYMAFREKVGSFAELMSD